MLAKANAQKSKAKVVKEELSEVAASLKKIEQELKTLADYR